jgi:hypothetical protein
MPISSLICRVPGLKVAVTFVKEVRLAFEVFGAINALQHERRMHKDFFDESLCINCLFLDIKLIIY